jgi:hypothetical protein
MDELFPGTHLLALNPGCHSKPTSLTLFDMGTLAPLVVSREQPTQPM